MKPSKESHKMEAPFFNKVLDRLPESFTRQEFVTTAGSLGYGYDLCQELLSQAAHRRKIERISRGQYQKIHPDLFD